ncbi:type II toxin-antitoxin system ParD family antitoxin [Pelagibius sp.]|uniref:type II toxin-antitoxin system ParD family antitoxin n=1 Tax=Pelagibius sp. TaxID=1931238 RepID=UPI002623EB56|nr:type II toxin-antitoxin system ParD family antitoxin [Pelagibius sp.]
MNVSLTPELEKLVDERVKSGRYTSASEVIREALRLLDRFDEAQRLGLIELNRKIDEGLAQADRGETISGAESRRRTRSLRSTLSKQG